ncbi:MAG: PQQ-binding-like beta-propeller repeat protein [Thermoanaerobaculia bacterium]|nr:PQQ-binding-like beta-propeller repeat protein [Thermoanaerobaculia bacterium]
MHRAPTTHAATLALLAASLLLAACGSGPAAPDDPGVWPQWRGPGGLGVSPLTGLPESWGPDTNVRWRTEIDGEGNSSPVVSDGTIYLTAARGGADLRQRVVYALDPASGEVLWETVVISAPKETRHFFNTFAAPTPVTDGRRLFVHFGQHLAALDLDGEVLWTREIDPDFAKYSLYGAGSSPVLAGDVILVAHDRETTDRPFGWIAAYAQSDGSEVWKRTWDDTCCSYSTPLVRTRGGTLEAVFAKSGEVVGYDPATGERLWAYELPIVQPVPTPVAEGDLVAVFGGGNRVRYGAVLELTGTGTDTRVESLWETGKIIPQTPSPVLYQGLLFTVTDNGVMICYDVRTGEVQWRQRLGRGTYGPSLTAGDGKVYASTNEGLTTVVAAERTFRKVAENQLAEGSNASPAFTEECLLLRSRTALLCIDEPETAEEAGGGKRKKRGRKRAAQGGGS